MDLQPEMCIDVTTSPLEVEPRERRVVRATAGDQHVVDRCRQLIEEKSEPFEVERVEGRDLNIKLGTDLVQTILVASGDYHACAFAAGSAGGFESYSGAATDDH